MDHQISRSSPQWKILVVHYDWPIANFGPFTIIASKIWLNKLKLTEEKVPPLLYYQCTHYFNPAAVLLQSLLHTACFIHANESNLFLWTRLKSFNLIYLNALVFICDPYGVNHLDSLLTYLLDNHFSSG